MAHPQVVDGRDSLQIWRVAANERQKQSGTANKECSSSFGIRLGANDPMLQNVTEDRGLSGCCEYGNELSGTTYFVEFLDQLGDYRLLRKDSVPWNWL
jgi:hypothetical protein